MLQDDLSASAFFSLLQAHPITAAAAAIVPHVSLPVSTNIPASCSSVPVRLRAWAAEARGQILATELGRQRVELDELRARANEVDLLRARLIVHTTIALSSLSNSDPAILFKSIV